MYFYISYDFESFLLWSLGVSTCDSSFSAFAHDFISLTAMTNSVYAYMNCRRSALCILGYLFM